MTQLLNALPGALAQGLIWGVMAIGVYITYKVLDIADLTVDGSICTGAAVCTMLLLGGQSPWLALLCAVLAGVLAGAVTGLLHVGLGIPPILAGILTQMVLWSVNLKLLGKANQALPARTTPVLLSQMDVGGALPVLLDDPFLCLDDGRAARCQEAVRGFAQGGQQALLFTCREACARGADRVVRLDALR